MDICEDFSGKQYESISSFHSAKFNVGGMTRVLTSLFLLFVYYRSKRNAANSSNNGYYSKALILPSYFQYIIAIMLSNLTFVSAQHGLHVTHFTFCLLSCICIKWLEDENPASDLVYECAIRYLTIQKKLLLTCYCYGISRRIAISGHYLNVGGPNQSDISSPRNRGWH